MANPLRVPILSRRRTAVALVVALAADAAQIALGPAGWVFFDQVVDVIAMIATSLAIGFHPLLLPTFVIELIPGVGMFPTWTGCVTAVILLRKRRPGVPPVSAAPPKTGDATSEVIDV